MKRERERETSRTKRAGGKQSPLENKPERKKKKKKKRSRSLEAAIR